MSYLKEERTVTEKRTVIVGAECDNCGATLEPGISAGEGGAWQCLQPADALNIVLSGGFGMWSDESDAHVVFCGECVEALWKAFPGIAKGLKVGHFV